MRPLIKTSSAPSAALTPPAATRPPLNLPIRLAGLACALWASWQLSGFASVEAASFASVFHDAFLGLARSALLWPASVFPVPAQAHLEGAMEAAYAPPLSHWMAGSTELLSRLMAINLANALIAASTHAALGLSSLIQHRRNKNQSSSPIQGAFSAADARPPIGYALPQSPRANLKRRFVPSALSPASAKNQRL